MTVTNSRASEGFQGCPASGTNTTASTTFENPPSSYRVPGNPNYQFVPGP